MHANPGIFIAYRPYITSVATIVIGLGWMIALRRRTARPTVVILGVASMIVGLTLVFAHYEPEPNRYLVSFRRK
jgi:hydrogenase/urease accessory protein HupE